MRDVRHVSSCHLETNRLEADERSRIEICSGLDGAEKGGICAPMSINDTHEKLPCVQRALVTDIYSVPSSWLLMKREERMTLLWFWSREPELKAPVLFSPRYVWNARFLPKRFVLWTT